MLFSFWKQTIPNYIFTLVLSFSFSLSFSTHTNALTGGPAHPEPTSIATSHLSRPTVSTAIHTSLPPTPPHPRPHPRGFHPIPQALPAWLQSTHLKPGARRQHCSAERTQTLMETGLWCQESLSLPICTALAKSLNLSEPRFLICQMRIRDPSLQDYTMIKSNLWQKLAFTICPLTIWWSLEP